MPRTKKKVCVFIGSRANYGSAKSILTAIKQHPKLELQLIAGASAVLDKYGEVTTLMKKDGFRIHERIYMLLEGENPLTMAKSTGFGLSELASAYDKLRPDVVLVVGDRFEVLAAAIAAVYMNIPLAHTMGGEVSGSIDESIRHAITKLAHVHFPASEDAKKRIIKMGENPRMVFNTGCPRMDAVAHILSKPFPRTSAHTLRGVGKTIDFSKPFLLVSQHPVTTEYEHAGTHMRETLEALITLNAQTVILWPNADAGSDAAAQEIRKFRESNKHRELPFYYEKNLPMDIYFHLMNKAACMIGNSSSLVREGSFIGTPAVLVGSRQNRRARGKNVMQAPHNASAIVAAVKKQLQHGPYAPDYLYGSGTAGKKIANILARIQIAIQKTIQY